MRKFMFYVSIAALFASTMWILPTDAMGKRKKQHAAKQVVNFKVDGNLTEWKRAEFLDLNELKDAGAALPKPSDFKGQGAVGWNANDPTRIYFAVEITDDKLQDINPFNNKWWEDDSMEFMFDFDNDIVRASLVQWTLGANGKDLSAAASAANTEWIVVKSGNDYVYEVALDPTKFPRGPNPGNAKKGEDFKAEAGLLMGLSFHYNDCENGKREHQIGWIPGNAWDELSYGDLTFEIETLGVEADSKLAVTWGSLKAR